MMSRDFFVKEVNFGQKSTFSFFLKKKKEIFTSASGADGYCVIGIILVLQSLGRCLHPTY